MTAIVYISETGFTKEYAMMLAEKTGLPVYEYKEALKNLKKGSEIIYLGWFMAGTVKGYKKMKRKHDVKAVCAVGLCETGTLLPETRTNNAVPAATKLFTIQGGYAPDKLTGIYKKMMNMVSKALINQINKMETKRDSDIRMLDTLENGGSYVCEENLSAVLEWCNRTGVMK